MSGSHFLPSTSFQRAELDVWKTLSIEPNKFVVTVNHVGVGIRVNFQKRIDGKLRTKELEWLALFG